MQVPVVYANDEQFQIGKAKILRQVEGDQVSLQSLFDIPKQSGADFCSYSIDCT